MNLLVTSWSLKIFSIKAVLVQQTVGPAIRLAIQLIGGMYSQDICVFMMLIYHSENWLSDWHADCPGFTTARGCRRLNRVYVCIPEAAEYLRHENLINYTQSCYKRLRVSDCGR